MRTIIAGSRGINDYDIISNAVAECGWDVTAVVSGTARGVDVMGESYGFNKRLPVFRYPAEWDKNGKAAGYIRNLKMADNADALIAIWDGKSRGTKHMIDIAKKKGLKVHVVTVEKKSRNQE